MSIFRMGAFRMGTGRGRLFLFTGLLATVILTGAGCSSGKAGDAPLLEAGLYPIGETISGDLDGDGVEEEILVEIYESERFGEGRTVHVSVNGEDFYEAAVKGHYGENPCEDNFYITRLDTEKNWMSIGLLYDGPSADPVTEFYRYQRGKLTFIGQVPGYPWILEGENLGLYTDEDGTIHTCQWMNILQTWFAPVEWKLNKEGMLEMVEQDVYYPIQNELEEGDEGWYPELEIHLLCELPVYEEPDDRNAAQTLMQPQTVRLTATDNEHWCLAEGEDGRKGWFYVEEYDWLPDVGKRASEVFENLHYAG